MAKVKKSVKNLKKKLTKEEIEDLALKDQVQDIAIQAETNAIAVDVSSLPHFVDASGGTVAGLALLGSEGAGLSTGAMLGIGALAVGGIAMVAGGGGGSGNATGNVRIDLGGEGRVTTDFYRSYDDGEYVMTTGVDGQFLVAGRVYDGNGDHVGIAKYNSDGTLDTTFGDSDGKIMINNSINWYNNSITIDDSGNVIIGGYTNSYYYDFAVEKYDSDGNLLFTSSVDINGSYDYVRDVTTDSTGDIIAVGEAYDGSYYNFGVAKFNSNGTLDTTFGGGDGKLTTDFTTQSYEEANCVTVDQNDNIIVAGYAYNGSSYDFAVVKYDSDGNELWKTTTDINGYYDYAYGVTVDSEGNIIVVGYTESNSDDRYDFAIVKYDGDDGSVIFETTVDFNHRYDYAFDVSVDESNNIIVAGYVEDARGYDFGIVKLDSDGNLIGKGTTDFGGYDYARSLAIDEDGNIIAAGGTEGYNSNNYDFAIAKYDSNGILDEDFGSCGHANNQTPLAWNASFSIGADVDLGGDTFTLQRSGGANSDDEFSSDMIVGSDVMFGFLDIGDVTQNSNGVLQITFDSDATEDGVEEFLQSIEYDNNNSASFEQMVVLNWTYNDGSSPTSVLQNVYIDGVVI